MLEAYKKKYHRNNFQYILIDSLGRVIETEQTICSIKKDTLLKDFHPFFEILNSLITIKNESFEFSCINLDLCDEIITVDITIHIQDKDEHLVIIENLTKHYNNYQLTAQTRNESIIHSQVLELKNEYLLEKEVFKNNFIANFSHQLRNPITASIIFGNILKNSGLSSEQKNYLDIILSSNNDLRDSIEDILDISKIESGKLILTEKVFNLTDLLNDIISRYKPIIQEKALDFHIEIDENLPKFLNGDQYRLKQIINNLLNNALAFTTRGSIILHISLNYVRAKKANLHIEVTDTGIGISSEKLDSIFERFTKIESATQDNKSIGLGLTVAKHLISEMHGNIKVESKIDEGSKFICNVSFDISDYSQDLKQELLKNQIPNLDKKHHILLVEDSEIMQLSILKILAGNGNFYLNIVSKGDELLTTMLKQQVDVILLSNSIQNFSATDLTLSIRNLSKEHKKTPIIALSSEAFKNDIKRFKRSGVNDVLIKPFDEKTLLSKIYSVLK